MTSLTARIQTLLHAARVSKQEEIQQLWSGYGNIARYAVHQRSDQPLQTVVVKHVDPPSLDAGDGHSHPRGWATHRSHLRKLHSYKVETNWYQRFAARCGETCRVPRCLATEAEHQQWLIVLEDLDAAGFSRRVRSPTEKEWRACVRWLAHFHATWLNTEPEGLWPAGTYWHLDTRPDELAALSDSALREAAPLLDRHLQNCRWKTLVHGDAKLANFCFSENGEDVAAVDFQYVGGGCGMKDLAYFVGSCFSESKCASGEEDILTTYFRHFREALEASSAHANVEAIEAEWRPLYRVAWTDFHRFLKGWSPGHWKCTDYSERVARDVIQTLQEME